eukprot:439962-Rhodomonas_salina.3
MLRKRTSRAFERCERYNRTRNLKRLSGGKTSSLGVVDPGQWQTQQLEALCAGPGHRLKRRLFKLSRRARACLLQQTGTALTKLRLVNALPQS